MLIEDVACPVDKLADMTVDLGEMFQRHGYHEASCFGHALEGNLHLVFSQVCFYWPCVGSGFQVVTARCFSFSSTKICLQGFLHLLQPYPWRSTFIFVHFMTSRKQKNTEILVRFSADLHALCVNDV